MILGVGLASVGVWMGDLWVLAGVAGGALLVLGGSGSTSTVPSGIQARPPRLIPDSALEWLRHAHEALGAWAVESGPKGKGLVGYQSVDPAASFSDNRIREIERRLLDLQDRDGGGGERTDEGTLVFESFGGFVAGLMLRRTHTPADLERAHNDLRYLLDGLSRRPVAHERAQDEDAPVEGSRSIALRLAHQVERAVQAQCVVALTESTGARIASVSSGVDARLVGRLLPSESPLGRVATGSARSLEVGGGAWAGLMPDRRGLEKTRAMLLHLQDQGDPVGAVAFWYLSGDRVAAPALTEVKEILHQAEPRFREAQLIEQTRLGTSLDELTGLPNRRALDRALASPPDAEGAVVLAEVETGDAPATARDAALVYFGQTLRHVVRGTDLAAHLEGGRFAVWLPGADVATAIHVANRIGQRLEASPWEWQGVSRPLSVRYGVAGCPESSPRTAALVDKARGALRSGAMDSSGRVGSAPAIA
jgi:GGDEF domain-containing protein